MLGNKRRTVVSGRLNFPVKKKVVPLPNWIDKSDAVVDGLFDVEMPGKRRFVDLGNIPVPRPTGPRADKRRQNKVVETSRWVGSTYCLLDNSVYGTVTTAGLTPANENAYVPMDYQHQDLIIAGNDSSRAASSMFSAPIGLRVMQQHYGARAGVDVGPDSAYGGYTINSTGTALVSGASQNVAWESGVLYPGNYTSVGAGLPLSSTDVAKTGGSFNTGSMWFNQLGFQWCPIGVNHIDKNDFAKLSEYKYFRFKKFGMRITIDAPTYHQSKKNEVQYSHTYAPPSVREGFFGSASNVHGTGPAFQSGGSSWDGKMYTGWLGDASLDISTTATNPSTAQAQRVYNVSRAGPKTTCAQPYGMYDYMIIGPERLQQLDLPSLMGYSDKSDASTSGLGALHVWDTLREHGIPVHRANKRTIDIEWKPYSVSLVDDPNQIGDVPVMNTQVAGPYSPVVEMVDLQRKSSQYITPKAIALFDTTAYDALKKLPVQNGYPYAHIGPVVLIRFAADPGVSCSAQFNTDGSTVAQIVARVNPITASVPIHVKCWSTYEAFGEDYDTFDTSTDNMWKIPVVPNVFPYNQASNFVDPTLAG